MEPFLDQNILYFGQNCEPKLKFLTCFKKLRKCRLRVLKSQNPNISTIKYKPCYDFVGLEFFEILQMKLSAQIIETLRENGPKLPS